MTPVTIDLSRLSPIAIGGNATAYFPTEDEFPEALRLAGRPGRPPRVLGSLTNTLFVSDLRDPLVFSTRASDVVTDGDTVRASAGALLCRAVSAGGIFPALSTVPGTVGAAVRGNAGAYGEVIADAVVRARVFDSSTGKTFVLSAKELAFGYRSSLIKDDPDLVVLSADFRGSVMPPRLFSEKRRQILGRRRETQPKGPSLGSVFLRCGGQSAGALIDRAGLKGMSFGGVSVSRLHAGFFVVEGPASANDFLDLIRFVTERVFRDSGVVLTPEISMI